MERTQFTFYRSFASALKRIRKDADRAKAYDAICDYALDGKEPDLSGLPDAAAIAFDLIRPVLDTSKRKSENGKRGANAKREKEDSKPKAKQKQTSSKSKQNDSKPEANAKRGETSSEKEKEKENEKEKEKELENECYLPLTPSLREIVKQWVTYKAERKEAYKPTGLQKLVSQIANATDKYGEKAMADVIERSMAANYQGIVFDWLERGNSRGTGTNAAGAQTPTRDWGLDAIVL